MPDADEEEDMFLGRTSFNNDQKSPANIEEHLAATQDNMVHFKALAKYYGVNSNLVNLPEPVWQATESKFTIATPEAHV